MASPPKKVTLSDAQWREKLNPEQYRILRQAGTEAPFSGAYHASKEHGRYRCAGCSQPLFSSVAKFDSGTGWPSFFEPESEASVSERDDTSHGMRRTEVLCSVCDGHLGHVFDDGPQPTGKRYCINSAALRFDR